MTNVSHGLSQSKGTTVALALGQPHHRTFLHLNRNQQESRVAAIGINTCTDLCLFPLFAWERSILHIVSLMNAAYDSWIGTFHDFSSSNLRILTHCWEQSTVRQTDYRKIYSHGFLINTFLETKILSRSYSQGLAKLQRSQRHQRFQSFHDIDEVASSLLASQSAVFLFSFVRNLSTFRSVTMK